MVRLGVVARSLDVVVPNLEDVKAVIKVGNV